VGRNSLGGLEPSAPSVPWRTASAPSSVPAGVGFPRSRCPSIRRAVFVQVLGRREAESHATRARGGPGSSVAGSRRRRRGVPLAGRDGQSWDRRLDGSTWAASNAAGGGQAALSAAARLTQAE